MDQASIPWTLGLTGVLEGGERDGGVGQYRGGGL